MSWMKRPQGAAAAAPGAEQQPYAAPQQYSNQPNMYQNYPGTTSSDPNVQHHQQQYWQMQGSQQYNQYGQVYQQQQPQQPDYPINNANQFYPQYNQNYTNPAYSTTQTGYQQTYFPNQPVQQQGYSQTKQNKDGWEDNWDWGWDESKQAQNAQQQPALAQPVVPQQAAYNNANLIEESFTGTNTWNWAMEEKNEPKDRPIASSSEPLRESGTLPVETPVMDNNVANDDINLRNSSNQSSQLPLNEESNVRTLNDRDIVKERLPNLALGKRFHLDNLTPQWSIESQMSQESSDGPHTQSESTYRSENQSRNSSKSSPGLNTENSNFNYSHSALDDVSPQNTQEWSKHSTEDSTLADIHDDSSKIETTREDIVKSMQDMNITNRENLTPESSQIVREALPVSEPEATPHQVSVQQFAQPLQNFPPPTSNVSYSKQQATLSPLSQQVNVPPQSQQVNLPPPQQSNLPPPPQPANLPPPPHSYPISSSPANIPPPTNLPPVSTQNPFKLVGAFSHKSTKGPSPNATVVSQSSFASMTPKEGQNHIANPNLSSPSVVNKIAHQQNRAPMGYPTANLETTPDNSERPDQPQASAFRPMPVPQQVPENLEVAPKNDRNEYLQTAHLSSGDYGENTDFSCNIPPPGLRRMVVGQQESEYGQTLNLSSDEPPPGLARLVPGQQTEADNTYSQTGDNYMDRHIDGQPTDNSGRNPFRQADGQQTSDNYNQPASTRRPVGLDRMVPGEPSNDEYTRPQQYQGANYSSNEQRVVTGVDYDYIPISAEAAHPDVREQNVDGSDYSNHAPVRTQSRSVLGARETGGDVPAVSAQSDMAVPYGLEEQREVTMEGENLQDLSIISSTELSFSRDQTLEGADANLGDVAVATTDISDSLEPAGNDSRRQSLNRVTSGEDSERDRAFKSSPRRDKHKPSRDREKDRYGREDRKYERDPEKRAGRDERKSEKDNRRADRDRRDRDGSPDDRRHRRSTRSHRYETEDTDYYSDRERERRRYREGSYTSSKPPRPDDKDRRYREDRSRRYATIERERRYELDERDGATRSRRGDRDRDRRDDDRRYERKYRDIDPGRKYGNLRRDDDERRRGGEPASRPGSGGAERTEDELLDAPAADARRRPERARRPRPRHHDAYYDGYGAGYSDPYLVQRQQQQTYQYYEHLRLTNPAAYMEVYNKIMAGQPLPPPPPGSVDPLRPAAIYSDGFVSLARDDRGSVHSGRSSANALKDAARYYAAADAASLRGAPSVRTDLSDRDFNTDASLNLHLDESTVRSDRMTPFKYSTAHVKGVISSHHMVIVRPSYPVDGLPATVEVLALAAARARDPERLELADYPGPLVKGVTHKKSVVEYCARRAEAARRAPHDAAGHALVWDLLALLLVQNGMVVGSDIAELLMKNKREYDLTPPPRPQHNAAESGRGSAASSRSASPPPPAPPPATPPAPPPPRSDDGAGAPADADATHAAAEAEGARDERRALDRFRELLIVGDRHQALETAMAHGLWGHAWQLAALGERRARAAVAARFLAGVAARDPLHTLYTALAARAPPAAAGVVEEKWGDWRPHLAMVLANPSAKPDADRRTIIQIGDSLFSRGLVYSAQFCFVAAQCEFEAHPLAPLGAGAGGGGAPRLSLLLAPARAATLRQHATNVAIFATEIYEYARSLHGDFVVPSLQVYKFVLASRLVDAGLPARALAYTEQLARAVAPQPALYPRALLAQVAGLADRLKYHDPALQEEPPLEESGAESAQASPRHQDWIQHLAHAAHTQAADAQPEPAAPPAPYHAPAPEPAPAAPAAPVHYNHYWTPEQISAVQQQQQPQPLQQESNGYEQAAPQPEEAAPGDYAGQYYQPEPAQYGYAEDWYGRAAEPEPHYWQGDAASYGYDEPPEEPPPAAGGEEPARPRISMPGAAAGARPALYADYDDGPPGAAAADNKQDGDGPSQRSKRGDEGRGREEGGKGKGGWFGGIFNKLSLRPPNQMILPDDKNPTIVWDADKKRWRDRDGADDEPGAAPPPPPPRAAPTAHAHPAHPAPRDTSSPLMAAANAAPAAPPVAPVANIFKMQKGRHIKNSYVDVFNPGGARAAAAPAPAPPGPPAPAADAPAYFIPQPQSGIYDPLQMDDARRSAI